SEVNLLVRPGRQEDLAAIAAIQVASPEAAQWPEADYLSYRLTVAEVNGGVAGFLVSRTLAPGESEILNLAIAREWRRSGRARALVHEISRIFPGDIFLEVRASNVSALSFYKSMGFGTIGTRENYYEAPAETAIVLKFHSC